MSALEAQPGPRFRVLGDQGAYVKFGMDVQEERLRNGANPSAPDWGDEPPDRWGCLGTDRESQPVRTERGDYAEFYRLLVAALDSGGAHRSIPKTQSRRSRSSKPLTARTHVDKSCACSQFEPSTSRTRLSRMTQFPFVTVLVGRSLVRLRVYAEDDDYARRVVQERRQAESEAPQLAEVLVSGQVCRRRYGTGGGAMAIVARAAAWLRTES